jgi:hypothetical protein
MMLREHFNHCQSIPQHLQREFFDLKDGKTTQGVTNSKDYWEYSATKLGMMNSRRGIVITERSLIERDSILPYGRDIGDFVQIEKIEMLVCSEDRALTRSNFAYTLLQEVHRVHLLPSEQHGNRKTLKVGLPGFACKHCSKLGRLGNCRVFPVKKRTLSVKLSDMYDHMIRCSRCPTERQAELKQLREAVGEITDLYSMEKPLFDVVWTRLRNNKNAILPS